MELVTHSGKDSATPADFRSLMSTFPSGVSIVTAVDADHALRGMTCSALCSVTVEPPTLLIGLRAGSPTLQAVLASGEFTVNLLHGRGRTCAELFASGHPDRFRMTAWRRPEGSGGPHLTDSAHAAADCRVTQTVRVGGQRIVFGEVHRITRLATSEPLLYGLRTYSAWPPGTQPQSSPLTPAGADGFSTVRIGSEQPGGRGSPGCSEHE